MYCPECGSDAGEAKYCPECGLNLAKLRSRLDGDQGLCPQCGFEVGDAKFCPECGLDLEKAAPIADQDEARPSSAGPRSAGRTTGSYAGSCSGKRQRPPRAPTPAPASSRRGAGKAAASHGSSAKWLWLAVLSVAVVIGAVVVLSETHSSASAGGSPTPVVADTSGTYGALVTRANGLYDQGSQALQKKDSANAANYFATAATVYAGAWKQQPGDASMGTDYATSLFYSGDTTGALKQVSLVLAKNPTFQNALANKGIYLQSAMQTAQQNGQTAKAAKLRAQAKAAFQAAVNVDATSATGQQAAKSLASL